MSNAVKDDNYVSSLLAALDSDGTTPTPVAANPVNHRLIVSDGTGGTDNGPVNAVKDGNFASSLVAVSRVDGITPVVVYADSNGKLLVQSS